MAIGIIVAWPLIASTTGPFLYGKSPPSGLRAPSMLMSHLSPRASRVDARSMPSWPVAPLANDYNVAQQHHRQPRSGIIAYSTLAMVYQGGRELSKGDSLSEARLVYAIRTSAVPARGLPSLSSRSEAADAEDA